MTIPKWLKSVLSWLVTWAKGKGCVDPNADTQPKRPSL